MADAPARPPRTIADRILAAAGALMIAAALYLLLFGRPAESGTSVPLEVPNVELLAPPPDSFVELPVELEFRASRPLTRQPGGWGTDGLHLHASLDGREVMPGPSDVRRSEGGRYHWTLPPVPPGRHVVSLFWSDASHLPIPDSGTPPISFIVR